MQMMRPESSYCEAPTHPAVFATTHWSVVLTAGQADRPEAAAALGQICRTYWYPLYAYVRRRGYSPEDAQDLTQEFFFRLLAKKSLAAATPEKGRFRSFLLGALKHFLADQQERAMAQKRGGGYQLISWEQEYAEKRLAQEANDEQSPDRLFDRRWALTVLGEAAARLRTQYETEGRGRLFEALKAYVTGGEPVASYKTVAATLGQSESAVKSAIYRLRQRYHELVREEVAQTVTGPGEFEEELRYLLAMFSPAATTF